MHYAMRSVTSVSIAIATAPVITHKLFVAHLLIFYYSPFCIISKISLLQYDDDNNTV